jgi:hypothetical protein
MITVCLPGQIARQGVNERLGVPIALQLNRNDDGRRLVGCEIGQPRPIDGTIYEVSQPFEDVFQ